MYSLTAFTVAIAALLAGNACASPIKEQFERATTDTPWTGTNKIYAIHNGEVNGCLDKTMSWVTEDLCDDFWVHPKPSAGNFWLSTVSETDGLTCQVYRPRPPGLIDCIDTVDGDTTFTSKGNYLAYGAGQATSFWGKHVPNDLNKQTYIVAYDDSRFPVAVKLVWGNPDASGITVNGKVVDKSE